MKMTQYEHVYQLAFMPRIFPVNCYMIEEQKELTLIDAALPYSAKAILQAAAKIGKPITRIILTHAHEDHIGALDKLQQSLPDAKVYISARDARLLAGDNSLLPGEPNTPIRGSVPKNVKTSADVVLHDGDSIGSLQAILVPGHTPGSMAFLDTRSNALIAGDAFQIRGGLAVSGDMRPMFPFPALATWNKQSALQSCKKLAELQPSLLAVGHGHMLKQPIAAMNTAIARAKQNFKG